MCYQCTCKWKKMLNKNKTVYFTASSWPQKNTLGLTNCYINQRIIFEKNETMAYFHFGFISNIKWVLHICFRGSQPFIHTGMIISIQFCHSNIAMYFIKHIVVFNQPPNYHVPLVVRKLQVENHCFCDLRQLISNTFFNLKKCWFIGRSLRIVKPLLFLKTIFFMIKINRPAEGMKILHVPPTCNHECLRLPSIHTFSIHTYEDRCTVTKEHYLYWHTSKSQEKRRYGVEKCLWIKLNCLASYL